MNTYHEYLYHFSIPRLSIEHGMFYGPDDYMQLSTSLAHEVAELNATVSRLSGNPAFGDDFDSKCMIANATSDLNLSGWLSDRINEPGYVVCDYNLTSNITMAGTRSGYTYLVKPILIVYTL